MAASFGERPGFSCASFAGTCALSLSSWTTGASRGIDGVDLVGVGGEDSILTDELVLVRCGVDAAVAVSRLGPFSQLQSSTIVNVIISINKVRHSG